MTNVRLPTFLAIIFLFVWPVISTAKEADSLTLEDPNIDRHCAVATAFAPWESGVNVGLTGFSKEKANRFEYIARRVAAEFPFGLTFSKQQSIGGDIYLLADGEKLPKRASHTLKILFPDDSRKQAEFLSRVTDATGYIVNLALDEQGRSIGGFGVIRDTFSQAEFEKRAADLLVALLGVQVHDKLLAGKSGYERIQTISQAVGTAYVCKTALKP